MTKTIISALVFLQLSLAQGSVLLVGGGSENYNDWSDIPYAWLVNRAPNKKVLILHYSTVSSFLPGYFTSLGAAKAVSTVITSSNANDSSIYNMILEYDGIFLRGGDQWEYIKQWNGTLTEKAIVDVYRRGGVVGGTSAGAMVLSSVIADAKTTSVDPRNSIRNPLSSGITFTEDFLGFVPDILCDTHFYERGRIGRLLSMLAVYYTQKSKWITGVGIDDATALGISSDGSAEVFGSGVVSMFIPGQQTSVQVLSMTPLGVANMKLRQLTAGYKFQLPGGTILSSPVSIDFHPLPFSSLQRTIILDGSASLSDWISQSGSLSKFLLRSGNDTIGIVTGDPLNSQVSLLQNNLTSRLFPSVIVTASPAQRNSPEQASFLSRCSSLIVLNVPSDSLEYLTDSASIAGNAFNNSHTKNILLLGNASSYAGESFVNNMEVTTTAAYRGRLTVERGLALLKGMLVVPRLYESDSYVENRASGLPWGIGKTAPSYGMFLDNSSHCVVENGAVTSYGASPIILFDLRSNTSTVFPTYIASGGIGPRQNAALESAKIFVLADSVTHTLETVSDVQNEKNVTIPLRHALLDIYPNPFNPAAQIEFFLHHSGEVQITVFDMLGRTIEVLVNKTYPAGKHRIQFDGNGRSSGLYLITLQVNGMVTTRKAILMK
jgi:cyanophycinase